MNWEENEIDFPCSRDEHNYKIAQRDKQEAWRWCPAIIQQLRDENLNEAVGMEWNRKGRKDVVDI